MQTLQALLTVYSKFFNQLKTVSEYSTFLSVFTYKHN